LYKKRFPKPAKKTKGDEKKNLISCTCNQGAKRKPECQSCAKSQKRRISWDSPPEAASQEKGGSAPGAEIRKD